MLRPPKRPRPPPAPVRTAQPPKQSHRQQALQARTPQLRCSQRQACLARAGAEGGGSGGGSGGGEYEHHEVNSRIGPAAASLLRSAGLPADAVKPSGPRGIVTKGDVLAALEGGLKARPRSRAAVKCRAGSLPGPALCAHWLRVRRACIRTAGGQAAAPCRRSKPQPLQPARAAVPRTCLGAQVPGHGKVIACAACSQAQPAAQPKAPPPPAQEKQKPAQAAARAEAPARQAPKAAPGRAPAPAPPAPQAPEQAGGARRRRRRAGEPPRFTDEPNSQIRKIIAQARGQGRR